MKTCRAFREKLSKASPFFNCHHEPLINVQSEDRLNDDIFQFQAARDFVSPQEEAQEGFHREPGESMPQANSRSLTERNVGVRVDFRDVVRRESFWVELVGVCSPIALVGVEFVSEQRDVGALGDSE